MFYELTSSIDIMRFINSLKRDNNLDFNGLVLVLLPFFDINKPVLASSLKNFATDKKDPKIKYELNKSTPEYKYTNL
tara:strand:- start:4243 stop:4473 length:231 start_codon:yes stop_codon:yes gene_type:complete